MIALAPPPAVATLSGLVACPQCGELKPEREVVQRIWCRHSQGMESEDVPCASCREEG